MQPTITSNLTLVRVTKLPNSSNARLMSDMRTWLDHQGIQPRGFNAITLDGGNVAFDVEFRNADQAALFRATFAA
jgi:hypothetical protein